jgi:hypothetical protein
VGRRFLILDTITYRKDTRHPPGHGYGRNVGTPARPRWVATRPGGIEAVIVHATHGRPGTTDAAEAAYLRDSPDVSTNDLIGRDGTLYEILPEHYQAWHSGACTPTRFENPTSHGIELHAAATEPITDAQKATLDWRLCDLRSRHHFGAPDVCSHRRVATPRGRKSDPGTWPDADLDAWVATVFATALHSDPLPLAPYTADSPLLAPAVGTPDAYRAAWQARCGGGPHYSDAAIAEIAGGYWAVCGTAGVDPWLAAAQCCHETGNLRSFWCARPRRNPAGIGCDGATNARPDDGKPGAFNTDSGRWEHGVSFAGWVAQSIPAHVGRLLAYALTVAQRTPEQERLIKVALAARGLPSKMFGSAPLLKALGAAHNPVNVGRPESEWVGWASPGDFYGARIAAIANVLRGTP